MEDTICYEKRKMAISREFKINELGKKRIDSEYEPVQKQRNRTNSSNSVMQTLNQTRELNNTDFCTATEVFMKSGHTLVKDSSQFSITNGVNTTTLAAECTTQPRPMHIKQGPTMPQLEQTNLMDCDFEEFLVPFSQHHVHEEKTATQCETGRRSEPTPLNITVSSKPKPETHPCHRIS